MNLPITHLAIVCIVVSSDGRKNSKEWSSYHLYHLYLIKSFGYFLSLTFGFVVVVALLFLTNMKTLALASLNIGTWHFVLSFFLISQYAQNFTMS